VITKNNQKRSRPRFAAPAWYPALLDRSGGCGNANYFCRWRLSGSILRDTKFGCVPFADVKAMCKYVGDKVGNRPITALRERRLSGIEIAGCYNCNVSDTQGVKKHYQTGGLKNYFGDYLTKFACRPVSSSLQGALTVCAYAR